MTIIRLRRGNKADLPASAPSGMPLWCEDTKELYIGTGNGVNLVNDLTSSALPVGIVIWFANSTLPSGFLKCNGAVVSRTAYSSLFNAIGTTFGAGDGSTTFNLPDLRGEFIRGWDDGRGVDASRIFGSAQTHQANSLYQVMNNAGGGSPGTFTIPDNGSWSGSLITAWAESYLRFRKSGLETRPRNTALLPCIKY